MHVRFLFFCLLILAYVVSPLAVSGRERVLIVGSSTVYPFVTMVVERMEGGNLPVVEQTGSGQGFKIFCSGVGSRTPDITMASRVIKTSERAMCLENGVSFVELPIGYDGIIFAQSKDTPSFPVTLHQLFLALAKDVPSKRLSSVDESDSTISNPFRVWSDIDQAFPAQNIKIYGPSKTSGTRDSTHELVMVEGAKHYHFMAKMLKEDEVMFKRVTHTMRTDGVYVETGENDSITVQKIINTPHSLGIFGFNFLLNHANKIKALSVENVAPTMKTIAEGQYPLTRRLYIYVKREHAGRVPGLYRFLDEVTSRRAIGSRGYLSNKGLIPLHEDQQKKIRERAKMMPSNM